MTCRAELGPVAGADGGGCGGCPALRHAAQLRQRRGRRRALPHREHADVWVVRGRHLLRRIQAALQAEGDVLNFSQHFITYDNRELHIALAPGNVHVAKEHVV